MPAKKIVDVSDKPTPIEPGQPKSVPSVIGATFAERKAARLKAIQDAENKAIDSADTK